MIACDCEPNSRGSSHNASISLCMVRNKVSYLRNSFPTVAMVSRIEEQPGKIIRAKVSAKQSLNARSRFGVSHGAIWQESYGPRKD
jgi:hypothetical protein